LLWIFLIGRLFVDDLTREVIPVGVFRPLVLMLRCECWSTRAAREHVVFVHDTSKKMKKDFFMNFLLMTQLFNIKVLWLLRAWFLLALVLARDVWVSIFGSPLISMCLGSIWAYFFSMVLEYRLGFWNH